MNLNKIKVSRSYVGNKIKTSDMTICLNTYTPNRYFGHASFEAQMTHDYILNFKSGRSAAQKRAAREVCLALSMTDMENVVFACVPASCNRTNTRRYRNFAQMVCERTGATNAYGHIIINGKRSKLHRSKAHMVCDAANEEIHLDPDMFNASAKVLLFDDIVSSGKSMREFARMVEETGAKVIGGIALGHTKHYKH